jgi:hypothetical protein
MEDNHYARYVVLKVLKGGQRVKKSRFPRLQPHFHKLHLTVFIYRRLHNSPTISAAHLPNAFLNTEPWRLFLKLASDNGQVGPQFGPQIRASNVRWLSALDSVRARGLLVSRQ